MERAEFGEDLVGAAGGEPGGDDGGDEGVVRVDVVDVGDALFGVLDGGVYTAVAVVVWA